MLSLFAQSELSDLIEKVEKGERLDYEAGVRMMDSQDILALGYMANLVRERKNGNKTYFMVNNPLDHTNFSTDRTNATMLYGDIETTEERIDHLILLRAIQDRIEGFLTFSPLPADSEKTQVEGTMGVGSTTGMEDLKVLAVSRILLDNIDHIKAFWMMLGHKLAQVSLAFGVDDLDGTVVEGTGTSDAISKRALIHMIQKAGRDAVERDTLYRVLKPI
ncbi:FO synthase subunit 2 [Candidatus Desulfosporosinus infrequens]|uniref:FO synthase subunit 2 n=1 Tax=Candidatus Desulfosporosinus infrequens TaxID=2043169 RepID=A0A2U3LUT2_9FIRM|nr:FO synthase subunit 2 [Candidatus Desulfosporosinus infrequens]